MESGVLPLSGMAASDLQLFRDAVKAIETEENTDPLHWFLKSCDASTDIIALYLSIVKGTDTLKAEGNEVKRIELLGQLFELLSKKFLDHNNFGIKGDDIFQNLAFNLYRILIDPSCKIHNLFPTNFVKVWDSQKPSLDMALGYLEWYCHSTTASDFPLNHCPVLSKTLSL